MLLFTESVVLTHCLFFQFFIFVGSMGTFQTSSFLHSVAIYSMLYSYCVRDTILCSNRKSMDEPTRGVTMTLFLLFCSCTTLF